MKVGIVGLPNAGKSTLFNALTENQVPADNYPFCTIDPNIGVVEVPDGRVDKLAEVFNAKKKIFATVNFVDIAGIVRDAHKGEGLGNKFLANIREVDLILFVLRAFENDNIIHTEDRVNPSDDFEILTTELALADIQSIQKIGSKAKVKARSGDKKLQAKIDFLKNIEEKLSSDGFGSLTSEEKKSLKDLYLFSSKKFLIALNLSGDEISNFDAEHWSKKIGVAPEMIIPFSAKLESEMVGMEDKEKLEMLSEYNLTESTLNRLIKKTFAELNMISFLTAGEMESRAWPISNGFTAKQAAGTIHTDFEQKFIKADVASWEDLVKLRGWIKARERGKVRQEGRDYIVKDGDVMIIKHGG